MMTTKGERESSSINGSGRHASPHQLEAPPLEQRIQEDYTGTNAKMIVVLPQIFPSFCSGIRKHAMIVSEHSIKAISLSYSRPSPHLH
jgi:hypothetical protein